MVAELSFEEKKRFLQEKFKELRSSLIAMTLETAGHLDVMEIAEFEYFKDNCINCINNLIKIKTKYDSFLKERRDNVTQWKEWLES